VWFITSSKAVRRMQRAKLTPRRRRLTIPSGSASKGGGNSMESLFQWVIVGAIFYAIYSVIAKSSSPGSGANAGALHCMTCGTDGPGRSRTSGSIAIEIVLWVCLIVPGVVYSIWRLTTRRKVCAACGSEQVVPYAAPAAVNHRRQLQGGDQAPSVERADWR
jgi:hypothetical protein